MQPAYRISRFKRISGKPLKMRGHPIPLNQLDLKPIFYRLLLAGAFTIENYLLILTRVILLQYQEQKECEFATSYFP